MKCMLKESKKGEKYPVILDGKTVTINNKPPMKMDIHLGSRYDCEYAASRWIEGNIISASGQGQTLENILLFGLGDCQIAKKLLEKVPGKIFIYEPIREIYDEMKHTNIFKILQKNPRVEIEKSLGDIYVDSDNIYDGILNILNDDNVDTSGMFCNPSYVDIAKDELENFLGICNKLIEEIETRRIYIGGVGNQAPLNITNTLKNMKKIDGGIPLTRLKKSWNKDVPVFLISAGPSLSKNINELKRIGKKGIIFSTDAAVNPLLKAGIIPDIVGSIDGRRNMVDSISEEVFDLPFLISSTANANTVARLKNKIIWGKGPFYFNIFMEYAKVQQQRISTPFGVAGYVFAALCELGTKNIIFVGQDLAYGKDGISHGDGRISEGFDKEKSILVDGYYGDKVYTRNDWVVFREYIENVIPNLGKNVKIINATEGGAKIHGSLQKKLKDIVDEIQNNSEVNLQEVLADFNIGFTDKEVAFIEKEIYNLQNKLDNFREFGYDTIFFKTDYKKEPAMLMILELMRQQARGLSRKERFEKSMDDLSKILLDAGLVN